MLTYGNVTQDAWASIQASASKFGMTISTTSGSAGKDGFTAAWVYDAQSQRLSIQCTAHPFFVDCSTINAKINDAIEACLKQHNVELASLVTP